MSRFDQKFRLNRRSPFAPKPLVVRIFFFSLRIYIFLLLTYLVVFSSIFFPIRLSTESMVPSIRKDESVLVSRLSYTFEPLEHLFDFRWQSPERGDLVVFRTPYLTIPSFSEQPLERIVDLLSFGNSSRFFNSETQFEETGYQVRRVIGIPGDTLEFRLGEWYIVNDVLRTPTSELLLSEREYRPRLPEIRSGYISPFGDSSFPFTLGEDEWFVAADNRTGALDSRHYGVIGFREIQGRVVLRFRPLSRFGLL